MSEKQPFGENHSGSSVDKFALFCAFISVASVLGAHAMDRLAQNGSWSRFAFSLVETRQGVDYTPTASIKNAARVKLDPCRDASKND